MLPPPHGDRALCNELRALDTNRAQLRSSFPEHAFREAGDDALSFTSCSRTATRRGSTISTRRCPRRSDRPSGSLSPLHVAPSLTRTGGDRNRAAGPLLPRRRVAGARRGLTARTAHRHITARARNAAPEPSLPGRARSAERLLRSLTRCRPLTGRISPGDVARATEANRRGSRDRGHEARGRGAARLRRRSGQGSFYEGLGWRLDADFASATDFRVVQLTPPGSDVLDHLRRPGSRRPRRARPQGLQLVVSDIEAARAELVGRGVDVSEVFHDAGGVFHHAGTEGRVAGPAPERSRLRLVRLVQRPGRQRLAAPGDQRRGCRAGDRRERATDRPMDVADAGRARCATRRSTTARTRRPRRSTTGRTGTPRTWSRASRADAGRGSARLPAVTWRRGRR